MVSSLNYGPFVGTLNKKARLRVRTPKGTIFWTSDHIYCHVTRSTLRLPRRMLFHWFLWDGRHVQMVSF